jgi:hypothetical protein
MMSALLEEGRIVIALDVDDPIDVTDCEEDDDIAELE